jgi:hypothetical protein
MGKSPFSGRPFMAVKCNGKLANRKLSTLYKGSFTLAGTDVRRTTSGPSNGKLAIRKLSNLYKGSFTLAGADVRRTTSGPSNISFLS